MVYPITEYFSGNSILNFWPASLHDCEIDSVCRCRKNSFFFLKLISSLVKNNWGNINFLRSSFYGMWKPYQNWDLKKCLGKYKSQLRDESVPWPSSTVIIFYDFESQEYIYIKITMILVQLFWIPNFQQLSTSKLETFLNSNFLIPTRNDLHSKNGSF